MLLDAAQGRVLARGRSPRSSPIEAGQIVAALPPGAMRETTLAAKLGAAQPLTIFADKAGPMRIVLADGTEALASVRNLEPPFGQIAILQPVDSALAEWRAAVWRSVHPAGAHSRRHGASSLSPISPRPAAP